MEGSGVLAIKNVCLAAGAACSMIVHCIVLINVESQASCLKVVTNTRKTLQRNCIYIGHNGR